jgi:hypothetical protein
LMLLQWGCITQINEGEITFVTIIDYTKDL